MQDVIDFPRQFYHGSRAKFDRFEIQLCVSDNIFGAGIFLTLDRNTASYYSQPSGAIYTVEVSADPCYTINLETTIADQSSEAQLCIRFLMKEAGKEMPPATTRAWDAIDSVQGEMDFNQRNYRLSAFGIWMIYGYMPAFASSGRCDNGVHYVLLRESAASLSITMDD